jgi:GTP-binding protein
LVVAVNKVDLLKGAGAVSALKRKLADELYFFEHAPFHLVSATRGDGIDTLLDVVKRVWEECQKRVTTGELNRFFSDVLESHPPPTYRGKSVTISYLTQPRVAPPTFLLFANRPDGIPPSYRRYIENQLRKRYGYKGVPLRIVCRSKARKSQSDSKSADRR